MRYRKTVFKVLAEDLVQTGQDLTLLTEKDKHKSGNHWFVIITNNGSHPAQAWVGFDVVCARECAALHCCAC